MATGPRPPSQEEELRWKGPRRRERRRGVIDPGEIAGGLRDGLGPVDAVANEVRVLAGSGLLAALVEGDPAEVSDAVGRVRTALSEYDPSAWVAGVLGRRAWVLTRALYQSSSSPVFAEDPHLLVPGCPPEAGAAITKMIRMPAAPVPGKLAAGLGGGLPENWHGYAALALLVEAELDELAFVLEGYGLEELWAVVYPGVEPPGNPEL